jgi:pyruvate dehydrogenase E2 component (dihydrolipoamide acetyltransferase)
MTMQEGTVIEWPLEIGAPVAKGDIVLIIESEKAEIEIEATASGYFRHIYVEPDEVVPCGTVLAALTPTPDGDFDAEAFRSSESTLAPQPAASVASNTASHPNQAASNAPPKAGAPATPAAKRLAMTHRLDLDAIVGSGPNGRITREDVEALIERRAALVEVGDGVSLEVPVTGPTGLAGPDDAVGVLLIPGFGTDVSAFARQVPVLAESYRVHGMNPRGVGLSDAPDSPLYGIATAASDAAAVLEEPGHVIGTSLGAAIALELALEHPERVRSLTLIAPLVRAEPRLVSVIDAWCALARELSPTTLAAALLPWLFSNGYLADEGQRSRTLRGLTQTVARINADALHRWAAGLREWSGTREADLERVAVPTLVIMAGDDLLTPGGESIAAAIPGAKSVVVANAGHAVMLEAPDAVNEALLDHLFDGRKP